MKTKFGLLVLMMFLFSNVSKGQTTIKLFNQKNLDGWYAFLAESGTCDDASKIFPVEKNMIRFYGNQAAYLMSDQSFQNFQLTVEFRWNTDSSFERKGEHKNSGIMYLIPSDAPDTIWPKGIQFQVKEGATGDFILLQEVSLIVNGKQIAPGKSVVVERFADASKPVGEWNTAVITVNDGIVRQELNGKLVNQGIKPSVMEGRILLQYEGYPIDFRKVEIKTL